MLINKLQVNIKNNLCSRHTGLAVASCLLLSVCSLLTSVVSAQQSTDSFEIKPLRKKPSNFLHLQRDPTRPPSVIVQQLAQQLEVNPNYELTAIFRRNNQEYAVLNGNVVTTGDPIADMYITQISGTNLTMKRSSSAQVSAQNMTANTVVLELNGAVDIKKQVTK